MMANFLFRSAFLARLVLFLGLFLGAHTARAQDDGVPRPVPGGDKTPLFWADGITRVVDLDAYQKLGLNTVVVRLTWATNQNGDISARNLAPQRAFALEAARRGLKIIYALPAAPDDMAGAFRLSADSEAYVALWTTWLQDAVGNLKNTPNLIGWMLPDDPRGLGIFDDRGFQRWIGENYANVGVINRQWDAKFESLDDVSMADVAALQDAWRGDVGLSDADVASGKSRITRPTNAHSEWAFHPAALALAHYKWDAYRALLTTWVGALRGEDAAHLVFSGRAPDYAQLLSLPAGIDIAVPDLSPGVAETDIVTHNPQSIDIARRGGKFEVLPLLSPRASVDLPASALPDLTRRWIEAAHARGARGVAFDSFDNLRQIPGLASAVSAEIGDLTMPENAAMWGAAPVNTLAILLAPLADGLTVQFGAPPNRSARGLYGFGDDLVAGEPSGLVWSLRWGTAFGGVDYLSPDDLAETPLDKYATILAPQTLSISGEAATQLGNYVNSGGVLVADLGLGALQSGGEARALPPALANLFGVAENFEVRPLSFNLNGIATHPLLPSWSGLIQSRPGLSLTLGDGPNGAAFAGPVGLSFGPAVVSSTATRVATTPQIAQVVGPMPRVYSAGLSINSVGRGYALFAPFRLWSNWRPGHVGFDTFLGDLTSRGATVTQAGATSLIPAPLNAPFGTTQFPEIINRATSITLSNHNAPGGDAQLSAVQTAGAGDWLWSGALCYFTSDSTPLAGGRPAPIANASARQSRARPLTLYSVVPVGESKSLLMRPVAVQNLSGGPLAAQIGEQSPRRLQLRVWPDSEAIAAANGQWQATIGAGAPVRLTLATAPDAAKDDYQVAPRSRHRLVCVDHAKPTGKNKFATSEKIAVADESGQLTFEFSGAACALEITPLP